MASFWLPQQLYTYPLHSLQLMIHHFSRNLKDPLDKEDGPSLHLMLTFLEIVKGRVRYSCDTFQFGVSSCASFQLKEALCE